MKFYCSVSTKNIQVNITPIIPRFTRVCRYLTLSEIGSCLSCGAEVIHITDKGNSLLNKTNYAIILTNLYKSNSNDSTKHTSKINVIDTHEETTKTETVNKETKNKEIKENVLEKQVDPYENYDVSKFSEE